MAYGMVNVPGVTGPELNKAMQQMEDKLPKEMQGATASAPGKAGLVPEPPQVVENRKAFLNSEGTWTRVGTAVFDEPIPKGGLQVSRMLTGYYGLQVQTDGKQDGTTYPVKKDDSGNLVVEVPLETMQGATADDPGKAGLVPAPEASSMDRFLTDKGEWHPFGEIVICNKGNGLRMTRDLQGNYVLDVVFPFTQERLAAGVYQDSSFTAGVNKMNGYAIRTGSVVQAWFFGPIPLKKSLKGNDLEIYIGDLGALMDKSLVQWTAGRAFVNFRHMGQEMPEQGSPQCDLMLEPTGDDLIVRLIGSYSCEVLDADDNYEAYVSMYFSFPVKAS